MSTYVSSFFKVYISLRENKAGGEQDTRTRVKYSHACSADFPYSIQSSLRSEGNVNLKMLIASGTFFSKCST